MSSPNASPCFPKDKTAQGTRTGKGLGVGVANRTDKCQAHVPEEIGCSCGERGLAAGGLHLTRILRAFLVERLWQRRGVSSHHLGCGASGIMECLPGGAWPGVSRDSGLPWHGPGQSATTWQAVEKRPLAGVTL